MSDPFTGYTVKLEYFKEFGKWHADGEYHTNEFELYRIWFEVEAKLRHRILPGLMAGHSDFIVSVNVPGHPHEHPHLIIPEAFRRVQEID
ncbi:hypothetical protein ANRL1_01327 [Anaerolineae bacterium]|nr:hypothetical protein ANRL1_01327 [Anaerolineae bacterium]